MQLHALEPLFKIFHTIFCKNCSSCRLKFTGEIADKYVENLKQASREIQAQIRPQKFLSRIINLLCSFGLKFIFFLNNRLTVII